ncbi:MAG: phosphate ABC transporter substrate-binding protein PstS [Chloroflexi bacterium]|nr:phosphate ABC transporter substrate-binding protein PstS [Chloroflexota bacterium]
MLQSMRKMSAMQWAAALAVLPVAMAGCGTPQTPAPAAAPTSAPAAAPTNTAVAPTAAPANTPATPMGAASAGGIQGMGLIKGAAEGEAKGLTGAGATFPAPLYSKWFTDYEKLTGVKINYQPIGSGGGIKSITDGTVDFGATDGPMSDEQLKAAAAKGTVLHIPTALGAVVPTYNVPGVTKQLKFTAETLSGIFLGTITKWNDPKLLADNPDAGLPSKDIITVQRSDGSGTTFIFADYLATVSKDFETKVGRGTAVKWPGGIGGKGNEGVSGEIKQNPNSIGYVELIYALQNKLPAPAIKNKAGKFIEPSLDTVTAAAAAAAANVAPDLRVSIVDAAGDSAYPISGFTWIMAYDKQTDGPKATALTRMLWWALHDGQAVNKDLGYAPLPAPIQAKAAQKVLDIKFNDKQAFPGK